MQEFRCFGTVILESSVASEVQGWFVPRAVLHRMYFESPLSISNRYSLRIEIAVTYRKQASGTNSNRYTKDLPTIRFCFALGIGTSSDGKLVVRHAAEGYDVRASGANRRNSFQLCRDARNTYGLQPQTYEVVGLG
jgi:hypothetical protein